MKNNVKYLVTGAAGFLGGTICRQLIERGEAVRAFVLPGDPAIQYVPQEAEIVEGDLTNMDSLEKLFAVEEGVETIVLHIASIVTVNPDYSPKVMEVNVDGTKNIAGVLLFHRSHTGVEQGNGHQRSPALRSGRGGWLLQPQQGHGQSGSAGRSA